MAIVTIPGQARVLRDAAAIADRLASAGIDYERWTADRDISPDADAETILEGYAEEIAKLKAKGGYLTADVIDVNPRTPGLDAMLERFNKEHWHDEDEVRFIVKGHGLFHIAPADGDVIAIEMEAGDLIRIPRGTLHWFNLCSDRTVRAIRLFEDVAGWTPHYTDSRVDAQYQPVCLGTSYLSLTDPLR